MFIYEDKLKTKAKETLSLHRFKASFIICQIFQQEGSLCHLLLLEN